MSETSRAYVIITRPQALDTDLKSLLRLHDIDAVHFPVQRIVECAQDDRSRNLLMEFLRGGFRGVIFTSANAVKFLAKRLGSAALPPGICCAVGATTAAAIEEYFLRRPEIIAEEGHAASLGGSARAAMNLAGTNWIFPCSAIAQETIEAGFQAAQARVHRLPLYEPQAIERTAAEFDALPQGPEVFLSFFSPSAVRGFFACCPASWKSNPPRIVSIGPATSKALQALQLPVFREAKIHTGQGLLGEIVEYIQQSR